MHSLATRPLLAVTLAIPSLLLLGYLWQKRRSEDLEDSANLALDQGLGAIDSREVSLKLENLNRSRLDCIEEERIEEPLEEKKSVILEFIPATYIAPEEVLVSPADIVESTAQVAEPFVEDIVPEPKPSYEEDEMTEKDIIEESSGLKESVPDVFSALEDPLCSLSTSPVSDESAALTKGSLFSTSPVKSESSESQRSSEAWSDLIERDEQEELERSVCEKLQNLELSVDHARNDSGVASPTEEFPVTVSERKDRNNKSRISSGDDAGIGGSETGEGSDSGQGSELCVEDNQLLAYHFYVQDYLCGTFIGAGGTSINKLKSDCNCNIILKDDSHKVSTQKKHRLRSRDRKYGDGSLNLCIIEGTRPNIDKCLDIIKEKFHKHPELSLEQVNKPENTNLALYNGSVTLSLAEGIMHDVFVSSIVNGGHVFVQQPTHPTFPALERLDSCMYNTYSQFSSPELSRPIVPNSICVAPSNEGWYRCQVVSYDEIEDSCDIKYIDYGGYDTVAANTLRQIRTDFLSLPFQGIECYLANIVPTEEDTVSASILEELVAGQMVQARMIGLNDEGIPMVHLYRAHNGQTVMVNRELVDRSCADWIEATIVPLLPDTLVEN